MKAYQIKSSGGSVRVKSGRRGSGETLHKVDFDDVTLSEDCAITEACFWAHMNLKDRIQFTTYKDKVRVMVHDLINGSVALPQVAPVLPDPSRVFVVRVNDVTRATYPFCEVTTPEQVASAYCDATLIPPETVQVIVIDKLN